MAHPVFMVLAMVSTGALAFDFTHGSFTAVLQRHVVARGPAATGVNYRELKKDAPALNRYLRQLEAVTEGEFNSWGQQQRYVFWVNAYNAYTLKLIIDHYPVKSIKDLGGLFSSPWKKRFFTLLGKRRHLDEIEHQILRVRFPEPRTHFAVNCASIGCPALLAEAYTPAKLEGQLQRQARRFLRDTSRNRINGNRLVVSKIFKWFKEDFTGNGQTVQKFVARYITDDPAIKARLQGGKFEISYSDYDWKLNDASR